MRALRVLLILIMLALPLAAISVNDFLKPYLLPGEKPRLENFETSQGNYAIVSIQKKQYFLLSLRDDNYSLLADAAEIEAVLRDKVVAEMQLSETLDMSFLLFDQFNQSRAEGEDECRRQTGTDRFPCTDKESCIVACRSVPNCEVALSYNIDSITAIQQWLEASAQLDASVLAAMEAHETAGAALDASSDAGPLDNLVSLHAQSTGAALNVSSNPLYLCSGDGKCFCEHTANLTALSTAGKLLAGARSNFTALAGLPALAAQLAESTVQRSEVRSEGEIYALVLVDTEQSIDLLKTEIDNSLLYMRDDSLIAGVNGLRANHTLLRQAVDRKNYTRAEQLAEQINVHIEILSARAQANVDDYRAIIDLQLNATQTIDRLARMELGGDDAESLLNMQQRLAATQFSGTLNRTQADKLRTDISLLAEDAFALFNKAERARLEAQMESLRAEISTLSALAREYEQQTSLGAASQELDDAKAALGRGELEPAGVLVADAAEDVAQERTVLNAKVAQIRAASAELAAAVLAIDEASKVQFIILKPDLSAAEAELAKAQELLSADPQAAAQAGARSAQLAHDAVESARANDQLALTGAMVGGAVLLVAGLYWLYRHEEQ